MSEYEYSIIRNPSEKELNDVGLLGWELVTVDEGVAYFKRLII